MSRYIRRFRSLLNRNETIKGLILVGVVLLGAFLVWGGIRLALNTEYPVLVVSSASMCPPESCTLQVGALIVIKGQPPDTIQTGPPCGERAIGSPVQGSIIVFRPYTYNPDYLVVHRVRERIVTPAGLYGFRTQGDNFHTNGTCDSWSGDPSRGIPVGYVPENQVVGVYQYTIPIPYLGPAILIIRDFMGQPAGIAVVVILIVALFALEVIEPSKKKPPPPPSQPPTSPGRSDERPEPLITDPDSSNACLQGSVRILDCKRVDSRRMGGNLAKRVYILTEQGGHFRDQGIREIELLLAESENHGERKKRP